MKLRLMLSPKPVLKVIVPLPSLMPPLTFPLSNDDFWEKKLQNKFLLTSYKTTSVNENSNSFKVSESQC